MITHTWADVAYLIIEKIGFLLSLIIPFLIGFTITAGWGWWNKLKTQTKKK